MNRYIICTVIGLTFILSCATTNNKKKVLRSKPDIATNDSIRDKYEALNDYFDKEVKDKPQKVIIIKEKINPNETINTFKGDSTVYSPTRIVREGGVNISLYSQKDWVKMKKKYFNHNIKEALLRNDCWKMTDFRSNKIILISDQQYTNYSNGKEIKDVDFSNKDLYTFSEPIYYKDKKTLTFIVDFGSIPIFEMKRYIVVMEKKENKWVEIDRAYPYDYLEINK